MHDRIILSLLQSRLLDGTSVMVGGDIDPRAIDQLKEFRNRGAKVGLHLNLTHKFSDYDQVWPTSRLLRPLLDERVSSEVHNAVVKQLDEFSGLFGSPPDFIDGHRHCHCWPAVVPLICRLPIGSNAWVRVPLPATWKGRWINLRSGGAKTLVIMTLAAIAQRKFLCAGLRVNKDFSGFLRLGSPIGVRTWLPRLLSEADENCVVMLHPGDMADPSQCAGHSPESRSAEAEILWAGATS